MADEIILQSSGRNPDGSYRHPICEVTGFSRQSIHRLERQGRFPARLQLGPGRVGWLRSSVTRWQEERQRGPLPAPHKRAA
ncbi:MAG: AlpA family phage regulatory protein [Deltaproteobacteria bacterium]|nr:AlpA family phage regulatory protein [Deltaproteobacteria bacterium]